MIDKLGMTATETARQLHLAQSTVSVNVRKGRKLVRDDGLKLEKS